MKLDPITQYILESMVPMTGMAKHLPPELYKSLITWLLPDSGFYGKGNSKPQDIENENIGFQETVKEYSSKCRRIAKKEKLFGIWNNGAGDISAYSFRNGDIWTAMHEEGRLVNNFPYKEWLKFTKKYG